MQCLVDQPFFFHSAKTCLCLSQYKKGSIRRSEVPFFNTFVSKVITTALAHKSGVIFIFPRAFKQKLRLRYTYTDSKESGCPGRRYPGKCEALHVSRYPELLYDTHAHCGTNMICARVSKVTAVLQRGIFRDFSVIHES